MLDELERVTHLYQEETVWTIQRTFGKQFVNDNRNGNPAIDPKVLKAFDRLTGDSVVWARGERMWRKRQKTPAHSE